MGRAKEIIVKVIPRDVANAFVKKHHYSGKITGGGNCFAKYVEAVGGKILTGYQLRYIYFIDKKYQQRLTVPILPFSRIDELGAGMYKGENVTRESRHTECKAQQK